MEIIRQRERIEKQERGRDYLIIGSRGAGYRFRALDDEGNVVPEQLNEAARENYEHCLQGVADGSIRDEGVTVHEWAYIRPAAGRCRCGEEVELSDAMTNECKCGRLYNGSGQELRPRSEWEEDDDDEWD